MKSKPKKHSLVMVDWVDTCAPSGSWHNQGIIEDYDMLLCQSVGWLGRKDKECIVMYATNTDRDRYGDSVGQVQAIPIGCITKITKLKVK